MNLQIWIQGLALETLEWVDSISYSTGDLNDNHHGYKDEVGPVVNHGGDDDLLLR